MKEDTPLLQATLPSLDLGQVSVPTRLCPLFSPFWVCTSSWTAAPRLPQGVWSSCVSASWAAFDHTVLSQPGLRPTQTGSLLTAQWVEDVWRFCFIPCSVASTFLLTESSPQIIGLTPACQPTPLLPRGSLAVEPECEGSPGLPAPRALRRLLRFPLGSQASLQADPPVRWLFLCQPW